MQLAESNLARLLEAAFDGIVAVDANGNVILANAQAGRLFGYAHDEMVGQPMERFVPKAASTLGPDGNNDAPSPPSQLKATELIGRHRDGSTFPAEVSLSVIDTERGVVISAAIRDLSDRHASRAECERLRAQAERERLDRRAQQAEHLDSLGRLAGGVAHDFNNLLCAITNYSQFVGEEISAAAHGDTHRDWLAVLGDIDQIQAAANRASALTHQLLAFARREMVKPRVLDINELVAGVEPILRLTLGEDILFVTSLSPDLDNITADPDQMEQVLVNLAVNARFAMPDGGSFTIDTGVVEVDDFGTEVRPEFEVGRYVRLRVSDTGVGMTPDVADRAFEPFFTTRPKGEGKGLGLATVYGIVTQAGGHARIYSQPDVGTTITMLFPITTATTTSHQHEHEHEHEEVHVEAGGETILIVEDDDQLRAATSRILTRAGYHVMSCSDGHESLVFADAHDGDIDLLLTDVVMPKMSGKDVAERMVAERPGTRVLFMSGYPESVLGAKGNLDRGVILIEKPFSSEALLGKVRSLLGDAN